MVKPRHPGTCGGEHWITPTARGRAPRPNGDLVLEVRARVPLLSVYVEKFDVAISLAELNQLQRAPTFSLISLQRVRLRRPGT